MFKASERGVALEKERQVESHSVLKYPHRLNFYDVPPTDHVTLEDFETHALDRLRVLAEIESSFSRNRSWEELKSITLAQAKKYVPLNSTSAHLVDRDAERRKDHIGHFVLRLAFCRSEDLRKRFVKAESALFRVRYESDDSGEREEFLNSRKFNWTPIDVDERKRYQQELLAACPHLKPDRILLENFYKVKWRQVPDLVEKRKVFLKSGWAYVPSREQSSIVFQEFETNLVKALELTAKFLPRLEEDDRLIPILTHLSQGFLAGVPSEWSAPVTSGSDSEIKAEMVDQLARKHFPMCMRSLHELLRKDQHLKHFGRLQYGLFLKVLGLTIDEALAFWRMSLKKVTEDQFNKEYKYNIRHSFGLEGKRANYPAKSCQQILMRDQPGPEDSHGCPFRQFSADNLQSMLLSYAGLKTGDLPEIMNMVKTGHYHVACTRVFEMTHAVHGVKKGEGIGGGESVTHPNQYAARSMELEKAKIDTMTE